MYLTSVIYSFCSLGTSITDEQTTECHDKDSDIEGQATGPIGGDLVTLSSLPKSRWHTLAHIDIIKVLWSHMGCAVIGITFLVAT